MMIRPRGRLRAMTPSGNPAWWRACLVLAVPFWVALWAGPAMSDEPVQKHSMAVVSDTELDSIHGSGLYFSMDLSLQVSTLSDTPPTVILNAGTPVVIPTSGGAPAGVSTSGGGDVSLSGSAQSNLSSLVNVIGTASVINVGVNIVNIGTSSNDTIYTTNLNTGAQGSGFVINLPVGPAP
ncbi:MAG TPA: hypothetical protein VML36_05585 [Nitrospiria bacterium]|nr:hypothetical protein [Nitrospiria bacterium]